MPPVDHYGAKMVTTPDGKGVLFIGGHSSSSIYELRSAGEANWAWTELEQHLKFSRSDFIPIYVPDYFTDCTRKSKH